MELVEKAKNGDSEAFYELMEQNKLKMYKTARAILKNEDDICDAIQETLISTYTNLNKLNEAKYFSTWIIRILINKCYDIISKNKKSENCVDISEIQDIKSYDEYESDSIVNKVLNVIEEDLKVIIVLYYYDGFSVKEISKMIDIPEGTVKSRLSRARNKLYNMLKEEEVEYE
ncbi:MAG: sigma-70 family RNA polymerase sigma factor [Clostridiales bacterium]|nr:sigma-70 family RNA polymerase sigma factor [Clostridiales bacterium]